MVKAGGPDELFFACQRGNSGIVLNELSDLWDL